MALYLHFLGRGSALNLEEGCTSAYFKTSGFLFLIDCGQTTFSELLKRNLLKPDEEIYVFITHFHMDNIGGLPNLVNYVSSKFKKPVSIVVPKVQFPNLIDRRRYQRYLFNFLRFADCDLLSFEFIDDIKLNFGARLFDSVSYERIEHDSILPSFSINFHTDCGNVFYSGDTCDIERICEVVNDEDTYKVYCDAASVHQANERHINIFDLAAKLPEEKRMTVFLMHFDNAETIEFGKRLGFEIVEIT